MQAAFMDRAVDEASASDPTSWWLILGYMGSFLNGVLGAMCGATGGFFVGPEETLIGACAGFVLFFAIGLCLFGPAENMCLRLSAYYAPPEFGRVKLTGFQTFDLYVTVHSASNVINSEWFNVFGKKNDSFVELKCGRLVDEESGVFVPGKNPVKRTCVKQDSIFEEVFTFVVHCQDDTLEVSFHDQDLISSDEIGSFYINITNDILAEGFPQKRGFILKQDPNIFQDAKSDTRCGILTMSFAPGKNFPEGGRHAVAHKAPLAYEDMSNATHALVKDMKAESYAGGAMYGTWATKNLPRV